MSNRYRLEKKATDTPPSVELGRSDSISWLARRWSKFNQLRGRCGRFAMVKLASALWSENPAFIEAAAKFFEAALHAGELGLGAYGTQEQIDWVIARPDWGAFRTRNALWAMAQRQYQIGRARLSRRLLASFTPPALEASEASGLPSSEASSLASRAAPAR